MGHCIPDPSLRLMSNTNFYFVLLLLNFVLNSRCKPCSMGYDVIIKFETLEEDSQYLIEQCGLDDRFST